jgi:hypothetical protein
MAQHKATAPTSNCFLSLQEKLLSQEPSKLATLEGGCNPKNNPYKIPNKFCYMTIEKEMLNSLCTAAEAASTIPLQFLF